MGRRHPRRLTFRPTRAASGRLTFHRKVIAETSAFLIRLLKVAPPDGFSVRRPRRSGDDRPCSHRVDAPLYLRRAGAADPDHRPAGRVEDADGYLPRHPHSGHQRRLAVYRSAARSDGRAHHDAVPARADDHRQRHRAYRGQFLQRLRHHQDLLSAERRHPHRQRPGHRDFADHGQGDAARRDAAADPQLQRLDRADRAGGAVGRRLHRAAAGRHRHQPGAHAAGHRARRGDPLSVRRQAAPDPDRSRSGRVAGEGPVGRGRRQRARRPEPDHAGRLREDRRLRICGAAQQRALEARRARRPADQDGRRGDGLCPRRRAGARRQCAANQHRPCRRQSFGAVAGVQERIGLDAGDHRRRQAAADRFEGRLAAGSQGRPCSATSRCSCAARSRRSRAKASSRRR